METELKNDMIPVIDYNHIFLYSKGHYQHKDLIEDLQIILSKRSNCAQELYTSNIMVEMLMEIALPHMSPRQIIGLTKVALGISFRYTHTTNEEDLHEKVKLETIEYLIGQLSIVKCKGGGKVLFNLGKPDPEILPLKGES